MPRKVISEELKQEIIDFYLSEPMSYERIKEQFNLSLPTIGKILKETPRYTKSQIFNPNLKERFFQEINTEEKAYFLGLLISDGNVFKDDTGRQASISITLDLKDEYMLLAFKKAVQGNTSISHDGRGCGQIAVRSNIMAKDLEKYGVVPRKTLITYLPQIPDEYMPHLIRGILDGDGSIQAHYWENKFLHSISFCGTHKLMENISNYLTDHLSLKTKPKVYDYIDKSLSDIKIVNIADMERLGNWLYKDASLFLIRKKEIYDNFIEHYKLSTITPS